MHSLDLQNTPLDSRLRLIDFSKAKPDVLKKTVQQALDTADEYLSKLQNQTLSEDLSCLQAFDIVEKFNKLNQDIDRYFGILSHLNHVTSTEEIRQAHREILPKLSEFSTKVGQSKTLYHLYQKLHNNFDDLPKHAQTQAWKRTIEKSLQGFELSGVALDSDKQQKFAAIQSQLALACAKFSDNVLDSTCHYVRPLTQKELSGISDNGLALLKTAADNYKAAHPDTPIDSDYIATLDIPMYLAVMQFADNRALREELYYAYTTRASDQSPDNTTFDNADLMTQIILLRQQKAKLLGFTDYSEYSFSTKMADDAKQVEAFLLDIAQAARPKALQELQEMKTLSQKLGMPTLEPWDMPYLAEKIRQQKFNLTSDELRPFFPLPVVLDGLFKICQRLFGINICAANQNDYTAWHEDVTFYQLYNEKDNQLIGGVYLDLFARSGKRGGAWLDDYQKRCVKNSEIILPVGFIVANFAPPTNNKPSLLSFDEVTTLFHEFGHALHHLLTEVDVSDVAGISGVEWDAVELPSQFMENFAITNEGIRLISRHVDTDEALPQDKLDALIAAKNFQIGLQTLRQLEFGLFDLRLHSPSALRQNQATQAMDFQDILAILETTRQEVAVISAPKYNRFANSFSHIFAGGYACGYYSYMWAEVLSADAFGKFEEEGVYNQTTGMCFRQEILAKGSTRCAKDNFIAFRGRAANSKALLEQRGLR